MRNKIGLPEEVVEVRRKAGKLRKVVTSEGRAYLLLDEPSNSRFLETGAVLGPGDLELLEGPLAEAAGYEYSCRFLSRRERSEAEVRSALADEGLENPEAIDYIVEALKSKGYIDDQRFAAEMTRYLVVSRSAGPGMVRSRLRKSGVPHDIIDSEVGKAFTEGVEREAAWSIARRRISGMRGLDRRKAAGRISGFLARRGYASGLVREICGRILSGEMTGDDDEQQY